MKSRVLITVAAVFILVGLCTSGSAAGPQWRRETNGFLNDMRIPMYWVGSNYTSVCFGDIDADGDQDIIIGSIYWLALFRNDGTKTNSQFTLVTEDLLNTGVPGADYYFAPTLGDLDGDGDLDMLIGTYGDQEFRRNIGTPTSPTWEKQSIPLPGGGAHTRPQLVDFNGDGLLDLAMGAGSLQFFANTGTKTNPILTSSISVPVSPPASLALPNTYSCCPSFCDMDGDGDQDMFVGFVRDAGWPGGFFVWFYRNIGDAQHPNYVKENALLSGLGHQNTSLWAPALVDIDTDGDFDLFAAENSGRLNFFENVGVPGSPLFHPSSRFFLLDTLTMSKPELADLDDDGDLDMLVGGNTGSGAIEGSTIFQYENVGTPLAPRWKLVTERYAGIELLNYPYPHPVVFLGLHPTFADFDADGRDELFVTQGGGGHIQVYRNSGTKTHPEWTLVTTQFGGLEIGNREYDHGGYKFTYIDFADLNGDGDLDLILGESDGAGGGGPHKVSYYENTGGSLAAPVQIVETNSQNAIVFPYGGFNVVAPALGDLDRDGDLDLVLGVSGYDSNPHEGWLNYFENIGTSTTFNFIRRVDNYVPGSNMHWCDAPVLADVNGDGNPDLFVGGQWGGLRCYINEDRQLKITPQSQTVVAGAHVDFQTTNTLNPVTWRVLKDRSGCQMTSSGLTASYDAGTTVGVTDVIEVQDLTSGTLGRAYINVISASQVSASGKAIVIAGRKPSDPLWETTNELAHYVFRTLLYRGFSKENVLYLNPQTGQDVDGNGDSGDDIDGASSLAAATQAFTSFAQGSPNLLVYLIDHGEADAAGLNGKFRLNESELLSAAQLDGWLDALQSSGGVTTLTLVVDCCQSGSFLAACSGAPVGKARIVVSSAGATQPAFFSAGGLISFTNSFVGALCSGLTVGQAFDLAAGGMDRYQQPAMDDDGDGVYNKDTDGAVADRLTVGASFIAGADRPQIGVISANQTLTGGDASATIWASDVAAVYTVDLENGVWATIAAPGFISDARIEPGQPVTGLPKLELPWNETNQRYEATTDTFTQLGAYAVNIYARDIWGGVAYPKQTYINQMESDEQMLIVCGDGSYDSNSPWAFSDYLSRSVYETARARWLANDKISYLTSAANSSERPVDGAPTQAAVESAISAASGIGKFTVYLVGGGSATAFDLDGDGAASDPDDLTPAELDAALDAAQSIPTSPTLAIVVLDFHQSGDWVSALTPPAGKQRVVVTSCSAGEASWCEAGGVLSFTQWFFSKVFSGVNLRDSFNWSRNAVRAISFGGQNPLLDDNGSGVADRNDGLLALSTYIGAAFVTGADAPAIGDYAKDVVLSGASETLWASGVWAPDGIAGVHAYVILPGTTPTEDHVDRVDLVYSATNGRWEATYSSFDPDQYQRVVYFAEDRAGQLSEPYSTLFGPAPEEDIYDRLYDDDTTATLNFFSNDNFQQTHNLWMPGDEDWALFNADANRSYSILVMNQSSNCDAAIYLYHESNLNVCVLPPHGEPRDDNPAGGAPELIEWWSGSTTGTMFVKVTQSPYSSGLSGDETSYTLKIFGSWGPNAGLATISGAQAMMTAAAGGMLRAGAGGIYEKPEQSIPATALSSDALFALDDPGDIGNHPYFDSTRAWLSAHPGNSSIVRIFTDRSVTLNSPVQLTMQFVDDGPTFPDISYTVDDLPPGQNAADMKIHTWTGSSWAVVSGTQTVSGDTVSVDLDSLGGGLFAVAPTEGGPEPVLPEVSFLMSASECFEGDGSVLVGISLNASAASEVNVSYSVGGTAAASADYGILPGSVAIGIGETSANIVVSILDDSETESDETLVLTVTGAANANLGSGIQHVVTIHDNEGSSASTRKDWTLYE